MKKSLSLALISAAILFGVNGYASVSGDTGAKTFNYKFNTLNGESFQYKTTASTSNEALERAAQACFSYYKKGRHISVEQGLDIIDVCVNPRNI